MTGEHATIVQHIRGSSLLLVGKVATLALDFMVQVLLVRYLAKGEYGALSWALAFVGLLGVALFELPQTLGRSIPLYRERQRQRAGREFPYGVAGCQVEPDCDCGLHDVVHTVSGYAVCHWPELRG